ncbi:MAG: ABC-F family ATP-binding cassette domain-containing protein [Anaerolineales bacterium]|nr:ABC-F family ATP-binding cassette domain-containing protein [Anaerolineales bacterium]
MSVLTIQTLSKYFGADEVFSDVSVQIPDGAKVALVGPNGAGKTTLLNIIVGLDVPTQGEVARKRGLTVGFLPQRPVIEGNRTVWDEMLTAFTDLLEQQQRLHDLEHALADPTLVDEHDAILERYGKLQETFDIAGGYTFELEIKRVLQGLGFKEREFQRPINLLSGGQVTRALLARLLLEKPELLILDEPTNHLDINAVEWLEGYLKAWEGAVLMVSHDRYFMDRVVDTIWELDFNELTTYRGNYSHYVRQREERNERLMKEYESQQAFIEKEQDYIRRNIAGQNTAQAKGRLKRLERLLGSDDKIRKPRTRAKLYVRLDETKAGRTGNEVLRTKELIIGYPDDRRPLFTVPDILLLRGEVAAVIGPNGVGKSTFLKTILDQLEPLEGQYNWGSNVQIGYFAQAHEGLNDDKSILDELLDVENLGLAKARNYLAAYLFRGEDVYRKVSTLSGGERGRLALAKLSLAGANVLLLDEPTNHLDIPAQEVLQNVLADYTGTILLVSHDRYLIDALASQIWAIAPGEMAVFEGPYQEYLTQRATGELNTKEKVAAPTQAKSAERHPSGLNPYQLEKRLAELEATIHRLEAKVETLTDAIGEASAAGKVAQVAELGREYTEIEALLNATLAEWERLA